MQPNTITLGVDELNNGTLVDQVFTRLEEAGNRSLYIKSDTHTPAAKDQLTLYRTFAKNSGNFKGVTKSALKFTKDFLVDGVDGVSQLTAPVIIEVSCSVPVGMTSAQVLKERQKCLALLDLDAIVGPLNDLGLV